MVFSLQRKRISEGLLDCGYFRFKIKIKWKQISLQRKSWKANCLFGQTTKQLLSNFEPWKNKKYRQLWRLGPDTNCLKNSVKQKVLLFADPEMFWKNIY